MSSPTDDNKGVVFSNKNTGNNSLYLNTSPGLKIWSALLLPEDSIYYQLTQASIDELTSEGVPTEVTDKLKPLKGQVYSSQDNYDAALKGVLTDEAYNTYRNKIYASSQLQELTLQEAFYNQVYFFFAATAPDSSQLNNFIVAIKEYLAPFRRTPSSVINRRPRRFVRVVSHASGKEIAVASASTPAASPTVFTSSHSVRARSTRLANWPGSASKARRTR